jgi:hypothetical protein
MCPLRCVTYVSVRSSVFSSAYKKRYSPQTSLWNSGTQEVWIRKSFHSKEFDALRIRKNARRQECYSEIAEQAS